MFLALSRGALARLALVVAGLALLAPHVRAGDEPAIDYPPGFGAAAAPNYSRLPGACRIAPLARATVAPMAPTSAPISVYSERGAALITDGDGALVVADCSAPDAR